MRCGSFYLTLRLYGNGIIVSFYAFNCFINLDLYLYVGQLAVGCGDSIIRIWNTTNPLDPYNVVNIWQGIKAKVTTVCVKI